MLYSVSLCQAHIDIHIFGCFLAVSLLAVLIFAFQTTAGACHRHSFVLPLSLPLVFSQFIPIFSGAHTHTSEKEFWLNFALRHRAGRSCLALNLFHCSGHVALAFTTQFATSVDWHTDTDIKTAPRLQRDIGGPVHQSHGTIISMEPACVPQRANNDAQAIVEWGITSVDG